MKRNQGSREFWRAVLDERWAEAVTLHRAVGVIVAGTEASETIPARALVVDAAERELGAFGTVREAKVFIIASAVALRPGDGITHDGRRYSVQTIRRCKDCDGRVVALRCVAG